MSEKTLKPGVVTGEGYKTLVEAAKKGGYALPAVHLIRDFGRDENIVTEALTAVKLTERSLNQRPASV